MSFQHHTATSGLLVRRVSRLAATSIFETRRSRREKNAAAFPCRVALPARSKPGACANPDFWLGRSGHRGKCTGRGRALLCDHQYKVHPNACGRESDRPDKHRLDRARLPGTRSSGASAASDRAGEFQSPSHRAYSGPRFTHSLFARPNRQDCARNAASIVRRECQFAARFRPRRVGCSHRTGRPWLVRGTGIRRSTNRATDSNRCEPAAPGEH